MANKQVQPAPVVAETLVELLQVRAAQDQDECAYTFLADGQTVDREYSYAELDRQARAIAARLQQTHAPGERVVLIYPPGLDYVAAFFGCLYAGMIAVPAYLPRVSRLTSRLQAIVFDAQPKLVLTTQHILTVLSDRLAESPELVALEWLATDQVDAGLESQWQAPELNSNSLAFLQYTSGSTESPKGVMVTHGNLVHNSDVIRRFFENGPHSSGVIWLPPYHDMGLIGGLIQPMYANSPVVVMSPVAFVQRPLRWLRAISQYRATVSGGPNFAYDLCVERTTPQERAELDLSCWQVAFCGAEPVRSDTLERFAEAFAPSGFRPEALYPCYGLAEATLMVTGGSREKRPRIVGFQTTALENNRVVEVNGQPVPSKSLVSCGRISEDQQLAIVDPETRQPCAADQVGEIWVAGPSVASGYWNREVETEATFHAVLPDGRGPFLRTGDLGFVHDGELFVTGRIKDVMIVRGHNYYPQDIERTVENCHEALATNGGAAFSVELDGQERVVVVHELAARRKEEPGLIFSAIRGAVSDQHDLTVDAVVLLKPGRIPKTSSGKIQRHACAKTFLDDSFRGVYAVWRQGDRPVSFSTVEGRSDNGAERGNGKHRQHASASAPSRLGGAVSTATTTATKADGCSNGEHIAGNSANGHGRGWAPGELELDEGFFRLFLDGSSMSDSSGLWDSAENLQQAQLAKLHRLAEMAQINKGDQVLDIGCGWGGMVDYCVDQLGARHAEGLTVSQLQWNYLNGLKRPNRSFLLCSWHDYQPAEKFDAITCIDALEHFVSLQGRAQGKHRQIYRHFFQKCCEVSQDGAPLSVQTIVAVKRADSAQSVEDMSFLAKMFPGSSLPYLDDILSSCRGLYEVAESQAIGADYVVTLQCWLERLGANRELICRRYGEEAFSRYQRYFEATIRCVSGGYADLLQLALKKVVRGQLPAEGADGQLGKLSLSPGSETREVALADGAAAPARSEDDVLAWLTINLAAKLQITPTEFDVRQPFTTYGLDSVQMVSLIGDLETWLGRTLAPTLAWDYPTTEALARHLASHSSAVKERAELPRHVAAEPIAIVGMGCRFPGADNLESYWQMMAEGGEGIVEIPADRWNVDELYDPNVDIPGKMTTRWGGFLSQIDRFDPGLFGITPREAAHMDPQQRLLLEVTWEALEHAGLSPEQSAGSRTGVFVGVGGTDYSQVLRSVDDYLENIDAYVGTGNALSIVANRLSYTFDWHGPSLAIDTACSSALVALHYAVQSLRDGQCDTALAGGVNVIISPETTIAFSKARMLSPDGRCKPFDANANGYVRGEGCGVVVLKRLSDAIKDGDNVLALLRGTAVNQDGRTSGLTAPSGPSQQHCIRTALAQADVSPDQLGYIEAHGTGTPLGDPIEVSALQAVLGNRDANNGACYMGSVKANIGHLETASGVAGLIKVVLMFEHEAIPPQRNFSTLNPNIPAQCKPFRIATELQPWPRAGGRRFAGVSGFGFGGTNAHVVLEESPIRRQSSASSFERPMHLATLSARSQQALAQLALRQADHLRANRSLHVADVCYTLATGRSHLGQRLAITTENTAQLEDQLRKFAETGQATGGSIGQAKFGVRPRFGFLFTGQGSQYAGMGRALYEAHPRFRRTLETCDEILRPLLERPLLKVLYDPDEDPATIDQTAYTQPALFAIEYAMARLWESWGIKPDVLLGHSIGEYPAACMAGVFSLEDGLKLVTQRGRLMQRLPSTGLMAAILAPHQQVAEVVESYHNRISIAAVNGPQNVVISGDEGAVREAVERFEAEGIAAQRLTVSHAFHSAHLDPMLDDFQRFAERIQFNSPKLALVSNLTGRPFADGEIPDAAYWRRHTRQSVQFEAGVSALVDQGCDIFLEVGPAPILIGMGRKCLGQDSGTWLPSLRKGQDDWRVALAAVGALHVRGVPIDWHAFDRSYRRRRLFLPTYAFERQRHWISRAEVKGKCPIAGRMPWSNNGSASHPLLGTKVPSALPGSQFFSQVSLLRLAYLQDHQIQGSLVFPGAGYVEIALAAAQATFGAGNHRVEMNFQQPLFLSNDQRHTLQVVVSAEVGGRCSLQIYHLSPGSEVDADAWVMHAEGTIHRARPSDALTRDRQQPLAQLASALDEQLDGPECYRQLRLRGMEYGPAFQGITQLWRSDGEAVAQISIPPASQSDPNGYQVHPALLDVCFQTVGAAVPQPWAPPDGGKTYLPVGVRSAGVFGKPGGPLWAHARLDVQRYADDPDLIDADVDLLDEHQQVLVQVRGLKLRRVGRRSDQKGLRTPADWLYQTAWRKAEPPAPVEATNGAATSKPGNWLILADRTGLGDQLIERLEAAGNRCVRVAPDELDLEEPQALEDFLRRNFAAERPSCQAVVHLWGLETAAPEQLSAESLERAQQLGCQSVLHLLQGIARIRWAQQPRLCLVTRGAQWVPPDNDNQTTGASVAVAQSMLWGLGRVIGMEHPELNCTLIDLDPNAAMDDAGGESTAVLRELELVRGEPQVVYRAGAAMVPRLAASPQLFQGVVENAETGTSLQVPRNEPFRLETLAAGSLDRLALRPCRRRTPGPGEVEIEVGATGLNFSDVLKAMGLYPGLGAGVVPMGIECAGCISAIGEGVDALRVGDPVVAIAPFCFASHTITQADAVVPKPACLTDEEAATIPITFLTAHYALIELARLQRGERVLIHAAAGGVGLAAIQICQQRGAEVFATAGSDTKRDFLRSLGITHVYDSRSLDFAEQILEVTDRQGVDVVLNSLPGEAIPKSFSLLRAYGRFLEIGKTDIYQNRMLGMSPFQDNLSFFAIDLDRMLRQRPKMVRAMFLELMEQFASGTYHALPRTVFCARDVVGAYRYMQQRKNIGKVVVSLAADPDETRDEAARHLSLCADGSYLVTGGLGALGLEAAKWLAKQGAAHLLLLGRSDPSSEAAATIAKLSADGVDVRHVKADVADAAGLNRALAEVLPHLPPLRGVIHAAGLLDDTTLLQMQREQLDRVLAPKVGGAWNLHRATLRQPLDFFVLFSSVACILGSPGQGNYAAGNAFLDALAHYRRQLGLPALSINWGPWAEVGMAARSADGARIAASGIAALPPEQAINTLQRLLLTGATQAGVMDIDWQQFGKQLPGKVPSLLGELVCKQPPAAGANDGLRAELLAASPEQRQARLAAYIIEQLARVMGLEPEKIDPMQSLSILGLDSLMAIELKNDLETRLSFTLPMAVFLEGPSVTTLAEQAAELLTGDGQQTSQNDAGKTPATQNWSPLVALKRTGTKPPIFCVHPFGGDVRCYSELARYMDVDRPVYALRARGIESSLAPHHTIGEMVADYIEAIRGVQPDGPYHLAGWSTGGIYAYEMARVLAEQDAKTALLVFFDSPTPSIVDHIDLADDARFLHDLVNFSNWFAGAQMRVSYEELRRQDSDQQLQTVLREVVAHKVVPADVSSDHIRRLIDVCRANVKVVMQYKPVPFDQHVHIVRPSETGVLAEAAGADVAADLGWGDAVGDRLTLHQTPGDHFSMMTGDNARCLAELLNDCLRQLDTPV